MRTIIDWIALLLYGLVWSLRRLLQLASIGLLVYWLCLLVYLFINGVGNGADDAELIAFVIVFVGPLILAPVLWYISEWLKFDD